MHTPTRTGNGNESLKYISSEGEYERLDLRLQCSMQEAIDHVDGAIRYCRENGKTRLLADIRETTGFPPPNIAERYYLIEKWASTAMGQVKMAMIGRREMIDEDKIGITMAKNRGFDAEIFSDEGQALKWLVG